MQTSPAFEVEPSPAPYEGRLMFTQSWEDPACDIEALRPQPGENLLAITSGCDNVLGFLLTDPARIFAVDINPAQTHLLELKMAAFRRLTHSEMLLLLGIPAGAGAPRLYLRLREELSPAALAFWDAHQAWFDRGLLTQGGFERYFAMLRSLLAFAVGRRCLERLFTLKPQQQREYYDQRWNTWRWRALIRIGCSRFVLGKRLDPSWFVHAEANSFGKHFTRLAEHAIADLPVRPNYFLAQILLGRYLDENTVPEYLRQRNFETIRHRLDRITAVTTDIGAAVDGLAPHSVDCFALSNVFEYSPRALFVRTCEALARVARPGARFALRNLLAPRRLADFPAFHVDATLSARLRDADRGFIYRGFEAARLARLGHSDGPSEPLPLPQDGRSSA
jgi:S-adenosylmethionine-diacylglycerol 3-amino-3-carboxypropyl transferase